MGTQTSFSIKFGDKLSFILSFFLSFFLSASTTATYIFITLWIPPIQEGDRGAKADEIRGETEGDFKDDSNIIYIKY